MSECCSQVLAPDLATGEVDPMQMMKENKESEQVSVPECHVAASNHAYRASLRLSVATQVVKVAESDLDKALLTACKKGDIDGAKLAIGQVSATISQTRF